MRSAVSQGMRDLYFAWRSLRRSRVVAATAVLGLSLAVAANASIFSLVDGLWFRPPGIAHPENLVRIFATTTASAYGLWSFPEFQDLRAAGTTCEAVVAIGRRGTMVRASAGSTAEDELSLVNVVNAGFFDALGVRPSQGRLFAAADDTDRSEPVIALGYTFWLRRFGGDATVVGKVLRLGRGSIAATVVGVLPPSFRELDTGADRDLWMPVTTWRRLAGGDDLSARDNRWFEVLALRRPGASVEAVAAQVDAVAAGFASASPATDAGRRARVISDRAYRLESGGSNPWALLGLGLLVAIITSVNVTNLLLARSATRRREFAVRAAIGASRWRLVRESFAESAVLGGCGLAGGLLLGAWTVRLLPAILIPPPGFSSTLFFAVDGRAVAFAAALILITTVVVGMMPARSAGRTNLQSVMGAARWASAASGRSGRVLVALQLASSIVLVSVAALLSRSYLETQRASHGMTNANVITAWSPSGGVSATTVAAAVSRLSALRGAENVALAIRAPLSLSGGGLSQPLLVPDAPTDVAPAAVKYGAVSPEYFNVLGIRVNAGRVFIPSDDTGEPVLVVNKTLARQFFRDDAVGQLLIPGRADAPPHRVIGVVDDVVVNRIGEPPAPYFYLPFARVAAGEATFLIRMSAGGGPSAAAIRAALTAVDPALAPRQIVSMSAYRRYASTSFETTAALAAGLGLVGLVLSMLGVYGVVAARTADRMREFGIRLALGAARRNIAGLVLREGGQVAAVAIAIGVPVTLFVSRALGALMFGISPWDPGAIGAALTFVGGAMLLATLLPAWRATRANPTSILREN